MIEWQPVATAGSALTVVLAAYVTVRQRDRADRKQQWWARTQWALDLVLAPGETGRVLGFSVLEQQALSSLADAEDLELLAVPMLGALGLPEVDTGRSRGEDDHDDEELP